jgi:hypothetical protein
MWNEREAGTLLFDGQATACVSDMRRRKKIEKGHEARIDSTSNSAFICKGHLLPIFPSSAKTSARCASIAG